MQIAFWGATFLNIIIFLALILACVFLVKAIRTFKKVDRYLDIKLDEKNKQDK